MFEEAAQEKARHLEREAGRKWALSLLPERNIVTRVQRVELRDLGFRD